MYKKLITLGLASSLLFSSTEVFAKNTNKDKVEAESKANNMSFGQLKKMIEKVLFQKETPQKMKEVIEQAKMLNLHHMALKLGVNIDGLNFVQAKKVILQAIKDQKVVEEIIELQPGGMTQEEIQLAIEQAIECQGMTYEEALAMLQIQNSLQ